MQIGSEPLIRVGRRPWAAPFFSDQVRNWTIALLLGLLFTISGCVSSASNTKVKPLVLPNPVLSEFSGQTVQVKFIDKRENADRDPSPLPAIIETLKQANPKAVWSLVSEIDVSKPGPFLTIEVVVLDSDFGLKGDTGAVKLFVTIGDSGRPVAGFFVDAVVQSGFYPELPPGVEPNNDGLVDPAIATAQQESALELAFYQAMYKLVIILEGPSANRMQGRSQSFGTGFFMAPGFVVTSYHVLDGSTRFKAILADNRELSLKIAAIDRINDLALLIPENAFELPGGIPIAKGAPSVGANVFTIGFPHPTIMGSNPKTTAGIVNSLFGLDDDPRHLQISAPIHGGNSGGPLMNYMGEVIGIITMTLNPEAMVSTTGEIPQNVNYALKAGYLAPLLASAPRPFNLIEELASGRDDLENLVKRLNGSVVTVVAE